MKPTKGNVMNTFRKSEVTKTQKPIGELEKDDQFQHTGIFVTVKSKSWTTLNEVRLLLEPVDPHEIAKDGFYVVLDARPLVTVWNKVSTRES